MGGKNLFAWPLFRLSFLTPRNPTPVRVSHRYASSKRWQERQSKDVYRREASVAGLKSRAAFKLLQINDQYKIFKCGQTVVDLGYAPGSWSQVAVELTKPNGRVVGVDIIPAQPPKGVSTIQGNFLSPRIQAYVQEFLRSSDRGRARSQHPTLSTGSNGTDGVIKKSDRIFSEERGYIDRERESTAQFDGEDKIDDATTASSDTLGDSSVDVVLSDMSAPWQQTTGFWKKSLNDPYYRMMNTSGLTFRDQAGSMDLCNAALEFSFNVLSSGGHFVCKYYQGPDDKSLENRLKALFHKVYREKPASSRSESKEAYFVGWKRRPNVSRSLVFPAE